jgi:hypothetical protein
LGPKRVEEGVHAGKQWVAGNGRLVAYVRMIKIQILLRIMELRLSLIGELQVFKRRD